MKQGHVAIELGHVHLYVRSLARSIAFYSRIFGLEEAERVDQGMAFLTSSGKHHTVALQALGESAGPPVPGRVGLYHVAFEVPDAAALEAALDRLDQEGVAWQAVDHGISWAVYFSDPDGNGLELYVDRRGAEGGRDRWGGVTRALSREAIRKATTLGSSEKASPETQGGSSEPSIERRQEMIGTARDTWRKVVSALAVFSFVVLNHAVVAAEGPGREVADLEEKHLELFDDLDYNVFSGQKWDELGRSHAEDVIVHWPDGRTTEGIDAHLEDLKAMFVFAPDTRIEVHPIRIASGKWTAVTGVIEGTFTEPMPIGDGKTIEPTGKAFKLPMATIGRWEGGTMAEEWLFWDNQAFMRQIGLAD